MMVIATNNVFQVCGCWKVLLVWFAEFTTQNLAGFSELCGVSAWQVWFYFNKLLFQHFFWKLQKTELQVFAQRYITSNPGRPKKIHGIYLRMAISGNGSEPPGWACVRAVPASWREVLKVQSSSDIKCWRLQFLVVIFWKFNEYTLPETNIAPENGWLEY